MSDDRVQEPVVEEPAVAEAPDSEAHEEQGSDDPWDRVKAELGDVDPELVVKNVKQYTQVHQQLAEERRALDPLREIQRAFDDDPQFAEYVTQYSRKREDEMDAKELASEALRRVQTQEANLLTQRALTDLHAEVSDKYGKDNDFDDVALLDYAARNRIANLKAAFLSMKEADLLSGLDKKARDEERAKKEAGVETRVRNTAAKSSYTREDIAAMSDEDFWANYDRINASTR